MGTYWLKLKGVAAKMHLVIRLGSCFIVLVIVIPQSLDHILLKTYIQSFVLDKETMLRYVSDYHQIN